MKLGMASGMAALYDAGLVHTAKASAANALQIALS